MMFFRKIPNFIYLPALVVLSIIDIIGLGGKSIIEKIKFAQIEESYKTIMAFCPAIESFSKRYIAVFLLQTIVVLIFFLLKIFYKERLWLLSHFSFNEIHGKIDKEEMKKYWIREVRINQLLEDDSQVESAIDEIDNKIYSLKHTTSKSSIGYYGVAHIPLVFYAGFKIGDQAEIRLFHRKRGNGENFCEIVDGYSTDLHIDFKEKNSSKKSNELVVAISTTSLITDDIIIKSFGNACHILKMELNNMGFDQLDKLGTMENLSSDIWRNIRNCTKKYSIQRIHMLLAVSVPFAFVIGRGCSGQMDPITVVYHFKNGIYPWGIIINSDDKGKLFVNDVADDLI